MRRSSLATIVFLSASLLGGPRGAAAAEDQLGAYLAGTCATCHQPSVAGAAIPAFASWDEAKLASVLQAFRTGERPGPIMHAVTATLSDDDVAVLAHYLATREQ